MSFPVMGRKRQESEMEIETFFSSQFILALLDSMTDGLDANHATAQTKKNSCLKIIEV
jgi:hypothetical protein